MGNRTRNHILEDESRSNLGSIIPSEWVVRDKNKDYGIDCEIEVFKKNGNTTGYVFWAQLKATDSKNEKTQKAIRMQRSKLHQLASYELPVMLLRFSKESGKYYFRWIKEILLHHNYSDSKTIEIKFNDEHEWKSDTGNAIISYLQKLRLVRTGQFTTPLTCKLNNSGLKYSWFSNIRSSLRDFDEYISISGEKDNSIAQITFSEELLVVTLMFEYGATFQIDFPAKHNESERNQAINRTSIIVLLGIGIILGQAGKYDLLKSIVSKKEVIKFLKNKPEILLHIIPYLMKVEDFDWTLNLIFECIDELNDELLEGHAAIFVLLARSLKSKKHRTAIEQYLNKMVLRAKGQNNKVLIAVNSYNLANFYREIGDQNNAISFYNKARKNLKKYLTYGYFNSELAGVLFDAGRYKLAKALYKKAVSIDKENVFLHALYGDAALFDGSYQEAKEEYDWFLSNSKEEKHIHSEWLLKYTCLASLLDAGGDKSQKRKPFEASCLANPANLKQNENYKNKLDEALSYDALCSLAWYNLGQEELLEKDYTKSFLCFLMSALINRWDSEAWVNVTMLSFNVDKGDQLIISIVNAAYFYLKESYLDALSIHIDSSSDEKSRVLMENIENMIINDETPITTIRFHNNKGKVEEVFSG